MNVDKLWQLRLILLLHWEDVSRLLARDPDINWAGLDGIKAKGPASSRGVGG